MISAGRPRGPNMASDPLTRAVMDAVDRTQMSQGHVIEKAGWPRASYSRWRTGRSGAPAAALADILEAIGADFVIVDRNDPPAAPVRLLSLNAIRRAVGRG